MGDTQQQLFLIEFLVDNVKVPSVRAVNAEMVSAATCVSFQILNLPPINICQEATTENCKCSDSDAQVFRKGKSCLFALPANVLEKPLQTFPIAMSVYKKLPPGILPDVMLIGSHNIETKDLVNSLMKRHVFNAENTSKSMKEAFILKTATGQHVGEVTVFIRISCFGSKIVTQFQIPHNEKPYLFKGADDSPIFQCKRVASNLREREEPTRCSCEINDSAADRTSPRKTCCPAPQQPPPCPPPTRQLSPANLTSRPCCPSSRG